MLRIVRNALEINYIDAVLISNDMYINLHTQTNDIYKTWATGFVYMVHVTLKPDRWQYWWIAYVLSYLKCDWYFMRIGPDAGISFRKDHIYLFHNNA